MTTYNTKGTCSRAINYEVADGVVTKCEIVAPTSSPARSRRSVHEVCISWQRYLQPQRHFCATLLAIRNTRAGRSLPHAIVR